MRMTRLRYMNCSFGCEWLAWVLRQHLRDLARESGVGTGQDLRAKLFGDGAKRKGFHPKPEAHVLAGARAEPLAVLCSNVGIARKAASAPVARTTVAKCCAVRADLSGLVT